MIVVVLLLKFCPKCKTRRKGIGRRRSSARWCLAALLFLGASPGFCVEKWEDFVPPKDAEYDWLQLTSGEWLKGDFKILYNFDVEFDSEKMNLQTFDITDVEQLITRRKQVVRLRDERWGNDVTLREGRLVIRGDDVYLFNGDITEQYKRSDLIAVVDGVHKVRNYWSGTVSIGVNVRGGNSDTVDANCSVKVKRRSPVTRFVAEYTGNFSEASGDKTADNHRLNGSLDRFITARFFWRTLGGEYYRDPFSNIDQQYAAGTGLGYALINSPKTEWEVSSGLGYQYQRFVSAVPGESDTVDTPFYVGGTYLDMEVTDSVDYLFDYSFRLLNERSGTYTHHLKTTLSTDFVDNFDTDISLVWDHVETPQAASDGTKPEKDDYQLIFSLSHDF